MQKSKMAIAAALVATCVSALAADPPKSDWTIAGNAGLFSDYRFRGISLSDKDPAFQPGFTVSHESGLYASVWGSNVADNGGDNIEIDFIGGYATTLGTFDVAPAPSITEGPEAGHIGVAVGHEDTTAGPLALMPATARRRDAGRAVDADLREYRIPAPEDLTEDAVVLAEVLTEHDTLEAAFAAYTERRFERCKLIVETSVAIGEWEMGRRPDFDNVATTDHVLKVMAEPI